MFSKLFGWGRKDAVQDSQHVDVAGDWAFLGTDMHSHFLPGIDDGAKTIEDSIALLKAMQDMGYKHIITTPHIMAGMYPNTSETVNNALALVREAAPQHGITMSIHAGAEYYIDDTFMDTMAKEPMLTVYKNEVLVECSELYEPPMLTSAFFNMQTNGYRPILAHPERYKFFHNKIDKYEEMKDRGCLFQLNMLAIIGYYGKGVQITAQKLLDKGLYDYIGTDMHHTRHAENVKSVLASKQFQQLAQYPFRNKNLVRLD